MVSVMVILFSTKCFLFVYMYIDLLKLKAYKILENSDADLSWLLFEISQLVCSNAYCAAMQKSYMLHAVVQCRNAGQNALNIL